jgi:hypothetical protein
LKISAVVLIEGICEDVGEPLHARAFRSASASSSMTTPNFTLAYLAVAPPNGQGLQLQRTALTASAEA